MAKERLRKGRISRDEAVELGDGVVSAPTYVQDGLSGQGWLLDLVGAGLAKRIQNRTVVSGATVLLRESLYLALEDLLEVSVQKLRVPGNLRGRGESRGRSLIHLRRHRILL